MRNKKYELCRMKKKAKKRVICESAWYRNKWITTPQREYTVIMKRRTLFDKQTRDVCTYSSKRYDTCMCTWMWAFFFARYVCAGIIGSSLLFSKRSSSSLLFHRSSPSARSKKRRWGMAREWRRGGFSLWTNLYGNSNGVRKGEWETYSQSRKHFYLSNCWETILHYIGIFNIIVE